jgi:tetrahydrodipicolinate N-succinyltransferase
MPERTVVMLGFNAEMHDVLVRQGTKVDVYDDDTSLPVPNVGGWETLRARSDDKVWRGVYGEIWPVVLGVASTPEKRWRAQEWAENRLHQFAWISVFSEKAVISDTARWGRGVFVADGAYVGPRVTLGDMTCVLPFGRVYHDSVIGAGSIVVGTAAVMGKSTIGAQCHICAGATVLPHGQLADGVTVGAGGACRRVG